jgi:predicted Zn-dependent protease
VQYENPTPREDINYSKEHPLKEFAQLLIGISIIILLVVFLVHTFAGALARQIPIAFEQRMVANFEFAQVEVSVEQQRLQDLANKLTPAMDLPDGMAVTVHYSDEEVVNAFATLGGNLIFFKGLLEKVSSEEELAAVMGHEIAHIKYRHPITAMGKGLTLATLAAFVGGASGSSAGDWLIGNSTNLGMMKFSRDQEREADQAAAAALQRVYGHIGGAQALFKSFAELEGRRDSDGSGAAVVEMFRSHPYSEKRWQALQQLAIDRNWAVSGNLTPWDFIQQN